MLSRFLSLIFSTCSSSTPIEMSQEIPAFLLKSQASSAYTQQQYSKLNKESLTYWKENGKEGQLAEDPRVRDKNRCKNLSNPFIIYYYYFELFSLFFDFFLRISIPFFLSLLTFLNIIITFLDIDIVPFERNRVRLKCPTSSLSVSTSASPVSSLEFPNDYINASYITAPYSFKKYIATQGPLSETVDDFWEMVWGESSNIIVMLTKGKKKKTFFF